MQRKTFNRFILAASAAATLGLGSANAQVQTEISFFYPVAVGGPITKIIDSYAADFSKAVYRAVYIGIIWRQHLGVF